jgi:Family of unknown function (DUF6521)
MTVAHDVFAETNPAFCAYALTGFAAAYASIKDAGPELPLGYVALPIALSGDLAGAFDGTNRKTGLLEWLNRRPQVQVELAERINASMSMVTEAVRFGCFARVLTVEANGRIRVGSQKLKKSPIDGLGEGTSRALKHAERLGYWFAMAGSTRTTFDMMGLTV